MPEDEGLFSSNKELQKALYDDLGHEPLKKLGIAFADVLEWSMPFIYKVRLTNERRRLQYEHNVKKLAEKINEIPEERLVEIPAEISAPIMDRLSYTSNEDLADLFINLLAKAADEKTAGSAHPSFVDMIGRLSADEAKILLYLKGKSFIPFLRIKVTSEKEGAKSGSTYPYRYLPGIEHYANCQYPDNIEVYLDNLTALGLINDVRDLHLVDDANYTDLYKVYEDHYMNYKRLENYTVRPSGSPDRTISLGVKSVSWSKGHFEVTAFGKLFIHTCTTHISVPPTTMNSQQGGTEKQNE